MKNRLQFNYYMPANWPYSSESAKLFIEDKFSVREDADCSLPAEPIVVFYGTEEKVNALLAIGCGGDGSNQFNNKPYYIIDFAKLEDDVVALIADNQQNMADIRRIFDDIKALSDTSAIHTEQITVINGEIETLKRVDADTDIRIKNLANNITQVVLDLEAEINRAVKRETELDSKINDVDKRLYAEIERACNVEDDIFTEIKSEKVRLDGLTKRFDDFKISSDYLHQTTLTTLNERVNAEQDRALAAEALLSGNIESETIAREIADSSLNSKIDNEISRATSSESVLNNELRNLISEKDAQSIRRDQDISLSITTENQNRTKEINRIDGEIAALASSLNSEKSIRGAEDEKLNDRIGKANDNIITNKVHSTNKTINVIAEDGVGTDLGVNVDNTTIVVDELTGKLSVASSALKQYEGEGCIEVKVGEGTAENNKISLKINPNDNVLVNEGEGLYANLSLAWVKKSDGSEKEEIQLIGKNGVIISRIDVADFIKDGMLKTVTLVDIDGIPHLHFEFNTGEAVDLNVKDLIDIYSAGNGLEMVNNVFQIKIDPNSEGFLTASVDGLKLSGVQAAINVVDNKLNDEIFTRDNADKVINARIDTLTGSVETINTTLTTFGEKIGALENDTNTNADNISNLSGSYDALTLQVNGVRETVYGTSANDGHAQRIAKLEGESTTHGQSISTLQGNVSSLTDSLNNEITGKTAAIQSLNDRLAEESTTRAEQDSFVLASGKTYTDILREDFEDFRTGGITVPGSIINTVSNILVANVLTEVDKEEAATQTLLRRITPNNGDSAFFYASNAAEDIMFYDEDEPEELLRRKPVQLILEKLIDENAALKERVTTLEGEVDVLQEKVAVLESYEYREALYREFADRILSSISATAYQLEVTKTVGEDGKVSAINLGFADDAIFQAGV